MAVIFQSSCQLDSLLFDGKDILEGRVIFGGRVVSLPPHISAKWSYQSPELKVTSSEDKCVKNLVFDYWI